MYHSFFIHSSIEGHLGCFQFWAIINKVTITICMQAFGFLPIFNWVVCFLSLNFKSYLVYFGYQLLTRYVFCKYFIPVCGLSFCSVNSALHREVFNFNEIQLIGVFSSMECAFSVVYKKSLSILSSQRYSPMS